MAFREAQKPHNRISAGGRREHLSSGEGESGRGKAGMEEEQKSSTGQRSGRDHRSHLLSTMLGCSPKAQMGMCPLILQQPNERTSRGAMELKGPPFHGYIQRHYEDHLVGDRGIQSAHWVLGG